MPLISGRDSMGLELERSPYEAWQITNCEEALGTHRKKSTKKKKLSKATEERQERARKTIAKTMGLE